MKEETGYRRKKGEGRMRWEH